MPTETPNSPRRHIGEALADARRALDQLGQDSSVVEATEYGATMLIHTFEQGGRVYACGNGGSMSNAMHFAEELTGRFRQNRPDCPRRPGRLSARHQHQRQRHQRGGYCKELQMTVLGLTGRPSTSAAHAVRCLHRHPRLRVRRSCPGTSHQGHPYPHRADRAPRLPGALRRDSRRVGQAHMSASHSHALPSEDNGRSPCDNTCGGCDPAASTADARPPSTSA
ncbi:SIS domain-containing protein [Rhodoferax fermentans]|uniref:SIS domain-containing protein n=2 Tax=Rhodoferax fermentans TaxID=28066 RepID=UPI001905661F